MLGSFRLGRIAGIEIRADITWFIIFALVAWSLATGYFPEQFPGWGQLDYWLTGAVAGLLLFASVLVHELAHAVMARQRGITVASITLFFFGGLAQLRREPRDAADEFAIAIVGPLTSLGLASTLLGLRAALALPDDPVLATLTYLAEVNLLLALFNLLPGFPLDGGRILRAILWERTGSQERATRLAATAGQALAVLVILAGLWIAFTLSLGTGLWLCFAGWFLLGAASVAKLELGVRAALRDLLVAQLTEPVKLSVAPDLTVRAFVDEYVLQFGPRAYPVVADDRLLGTISAGDVRRVPAAEWGRRRVAEVMRPAHEIVSLAPRDSLADALDLFGTTGASHVPVVDEGRLVGLLSHERVVNLLVTLQEFGPGRTGGGR